MPDTELKPCPFCGGMPQIKVQKVEYGLSGTIIRCNKCQVSLYSPDAQGVCENGKLKNKPIPNHTDIGIEKWNRRERNG